MDIGIISEMNPWWEYEEVPVKYRKGIPRSIYHQLLPLLKTRQILSLVGLRRTGKTTLM